MLFTRPSLLSWGGAGESFFFWLDEAEEEDFSLLYPFVATAPFFAWFDAMIVCNYYERGTEQIKQRWA